MYLSYFEVKFQLYKQAPKQKKKHNQLNYPQYNLLSNIIKFNITNHIRDYSDAKTFQKPPHKQKRWVLHQLTKLLHVTIKTIFKLSVWSSSIDNSNITMLNIITRVQTQNLRVVCVSFKAYFGKRDGQPSYYVGDCSDHQWLHFHFYQHSNENYQLNRKKTVIILNFI